MPDAEPPPIRIFINYRHDDARGNVRVIYDALVERYGRDAVFLDVETLRPGMNWLKEIRSAAGTGVVLALMGDRWLTLFKERERDKRDDVVRMEIEYALRLAPAVQVIPVLLDDAAPPMKDLLPRSLWPFTEIEVEQIRSRRYDEDLAHLLGVLDEIAARPPEVEAHSVPAVVTQMAPLGVVDDDVARAPDERHYDQVLQYLLDGSPVVPVLGPGINYAAAHWVEGSDAPPDSRALATGLADHFKLPGNGGHDLAAIAQYVYTTKGEPDLYKTLKRFLSTSAPGPVHRFFASMPRRLAELGAERCYQLIVSITYDTALEQAFAEIDEPYDLVVYMANGDDMGKFVHCPYGGDPQTITLPNKYGDLPISEDGEIERTLIVKIHGAVDDKTGPYRWKENFVVTEDHYIDYLARSPVENLVPVQILDSLKGGHCLFLGYTMHDWHLRVFLHRIWLGKRLAAKSWAVQLDPDVLDKEFWSRSNVDLYRAPVGDYVTQFSQRLHSQPAEA